MQPVFRLFTYWLGDLHWTQSPEFWQKLSLEGLMIILNRTVKCEVRYIQTFMEIRWHFRARDISRWFIILGPHESWISVEYRNVFLGFICFSSNGNTWISHQTHYINQLSALHINSRDYIWNTLKCGVCFKTEWYKITEIYFTHMLQCLSSYHVVF